MGLAGAWLGPDWDLIGTRLGLVGGAAGIWRERGVLAG